MIKKCITLFVPLAFGLFFTSCLPSQPRCTDYEDNFEALWKIIDERYCFLEDKDIDWDEVRLEYKTRLEKGVKNDFEFFALMTKMLRELKDGHVNLISSFDNGRYHDFVGDETKGLNIYARNKALGHPVFHISGGMRYARYSVTDNDATFGYLSYSSFSSSLGDMNFILDYFSDTDGIILDVRGNGGGLVENANKLASYFFEEKILVGYTSHKLSPRRGDFSEPKPLYITPNKGKKWTKKPLIILQDRGCYSATNDFLYKVTNAKNVVRIGLRSGGGAGMPASSELPNGWRVRYSAVKSYNSKMEFVEDGIDPDIVVENESYYEKPDAIDNILNRAILYLLQHKHGKLDNKPNE